MTQDELAKAVGVSRVTIYNIEKSKIVPSTLLAFRIARFFKKPFEETFFVIEDENNESGIAGG